VFIGLLLAQVALRIATSQAQDYFKHETPSPN
jgi:hypothetical protein